MEPLLRECQRFSIAPMMAYTDRFCRLIMRGLSQKATLYTEMVSTGSLLHGNRQRFLQFHPEEQPLVLQLGGSVPKDLAYCCELAQDFGYREVNLNVGCPSDRATDGKMGVCLMKEPELVAQCLSAMRSAVDIPVTVKTRIGVDDLDSEDFLFRFVDRVAAEGITHWIIHARKAWLKGLSPKENRTVPPLCYARVSRLKEQFPGLYIELNGGITEYQSTFEQNPWADGLMVGREAYHNLWSLAQIDSFYGEPAPCSSRTELLLWYRTYVEKHLEEGVPLYPLVKHLLGLFKGMPGGRKARQIISGMTGVEGMNQGLTLFDELLQHCKASEETDVDSVTRE